MQSRFVLVDKNEGKSTAENPLDTKASARIVFPGYADPDALDIRRDSPTACRTADVQAAFLKREFQDKDRVLYCWLPRNGPALRGVQPGSLLLAHLKEFLD